MKTAVSKKKTNRLLLLWVLLAIVVLVSCLSIGVALAWLQFQTTKETEGNLHLGSVEFEIYNGNQKITTDKENADEVSTSTGSRVEIPGGTAIRGTNITVRNTGTINAIIRATVNIYYLDENGNKVIPIITSGSPTADNEIAVETNGWVQDYKENVASGYQFYNSQIMPYTITKNYVDTDGTVVKRTQEVTASAVAIVTQILVPQSMITTTYYIEVSVDGVAWAGNIYQELADKEEGEDYEIQVDAYPFGTPEGLPTDWTAWTRDSNFNWKQ